MTKKTRVVIADFHASGREMTAAVLECRAADYEIAGLAGTGMEALELCARLQPRLLILSLLLPELIGPEVVRRLAREAPTVRTLIFSGTVEEALLLDGLRCQPHGFAHKSEPLQTFLDAAAAVARGATYFSPFATALVYRRTLAKAAGRQSQQITPRFSPRQLAGGTMLKTSLSAVNADTAHTHEAAQEAAGTYLAGAGNENGVKQADSISSASEAVFSTPDEEGLSERERDVLIFVTQGFSNKEVAERLHLSVRTVENHRARLMLKLGVRNLAELTLYAMRAGLVATRKGTAF